MFLLISIFVIVVFVMDILLASIEYIEDDVLTSYLLLEMSPFQFK